MHAFNQRTIVEILDMIHTLGALVGAPTAPSGWQTNTQWRSLAPPTCRAFATAAQSLFRGVGRADDFRHRLGVRAVEAAGGVDIFADRAACKSAKDRIVSAEES